MSWDLQGNHVDDALYTSLLVPMRPAPGKVSRTEQLPPRAATARAATDTAAPVQAFGGTFSLDAAFAPHLDAPPPVQCDGGVGAAGDRYEAHADAVADAVVRGESAAALLDAGADGAPAVQREEMTRAERRTAVTESAGHALELEQLAHRIAYLDTVDRLTQADRDGLTTMGFDLARVRPVMGRGDLEFWVFPKAAGTAGANHAPVIAFRGTATMDDVAEDATESGVGMGQFTMNQALITREIHALGGGVIATGHSLGGALAQIAACYFPDQIASVVTFQAPAIASEVIDRIRDRRDGHRPDAHHYRVDGCIVDDAGAEHLPGAVSVFGDGTDPIHAHTTFPLLAEHGGDDGWIRRPDTPPPLGAAVDPAIGGARRETTTDASMPDQARALAVGGTAEFGRTHPVITAGGLGAAGGGEAAGPLGALAGGVVAAGGAAIGGAEIMEDAGRRDRYARLWIDEVVPAAQAVTQVPIDDFITRRCREQDIAGDVSAMLANYRGLFPELAAADAVYRELGSSDAPSEDTFVDRVLRHARTIDDAGRERVHRYWANLPAGRSAATTAPSSDRSADIDRDHAAGRDALERLSSPHTDREPAAAPRAERAPRRHGLHGMVAPDRGQIADAPADTIHAHAARGVSGSGGVLPHLEAIQHSFGHHDVSGVRAHVGGIAAEASHAIGAAAYATGDDVAFAGAPDLRQAAHEAAHVVQQRGGVRLDGGVGRAGDPYERHADDVAALVTRGESAEALLDTMAHRGASGGAAVQREVFPDENGAILRDHVAGLTAVPTLRRQLVELRTALAGASGPVLVTVRLVGRTEEVRVASVTVRTIATQLESRIASMGGAEDGPDAAPAGIEPAAPRTRASAPDPDAPRARTGAGGGGHRERPLAEGEAHVTRERELIQARFPAPFGPIEVSASLAASAEVGAPEAESEGGHPPPGRITVDTVESTDESGATTRHLSVEGEGLLRRMLDRDLAGCSDHFEISPEHDGLHFNAGLNLPEAQVGPIHLQFAIDLVDYDPGATGRSALTILSPSATASVPLSIEARTALGLDVGAHAELEIRAQYYPQADQILAALQRQFAPYFASLTAEAGAGAGAAAAEAGVGGEVAEGSAVVAEGGLLGTAAAITAVVLSFGAIFATDSSTAEGERMAQQIAIYEYGQEFADLITNTVGEHDATPSEAVRRARAQARSDAGRATAAQRRQLASAGYAAISLAASRAQAERQGTTFEATWFD